MVNRKGLGKGRGKGYKNLTGKDPKVHSQSAKGMKQPQRMSMAQKLAVTKNLKLKDSDRDGVADSMDCQPLNPKMQDNLKVPSHIIKLVESLGSGDSFYIEDTLSYDGKHLVFEIEKVPLNASDLTKLKDKNLHLKSLGYGTVATGGVYRKTIHTYSYVFEVK